MAAATREMFTDEGWKWLLVLLAVRRGGVREREAARWHGLSVRQLRRRLRRIEDALGRIRRDEIRKCERCDAWIPADARSDRFYCYPATKCRKAGSRAGVRVRGRRATVKPRRYTAAERKALRELDREFGF